MITFQRMVIYHIQDNFQTVFMKPFNHFFETVGFISAVNNITVFQSKKV